MRILVTGRDGQLGQALQYLDWIDHTLFFRGRQECDIGSRDAVFATIAGTEPDVVINAAAYTAVDRAESEREAAHAVNASGSGWLAEACAGSGAALIHVSTDYVFDGTKAEPYVETDPINPTGVYGATKAAGEALIREKLDRHVILRTSWVFSETGQNFVKTMLRLAASRPEIAVVADQHGGPTDAADLAAAIRTITTRIDGGHGAWGTFHLGGVPWTTWYGFATAIFEALPPESRLKLRPITTAEYPTPARRPANSRLDCGKIERDYGIESPDWRPALTQVIQTIGRQQGI